MPTTKEDTYINIRRLSVYSSYVFRNGAALEEMVSSNADRSSITLFRTGTIFFFSAAAARSNWELSFQPLVQGSLPRACGMLCDLHVPL